MSSTSERAEQVFLDAIERPVGERRGFVTERCGDDDELQRSVLSLLRVYEETGPFDRLRGDFPRLRDGLLRRAAGTEEMTDDQDARIRVRPGTRLGRYEIVDRLGEGGMGEVFRAEDPRLERQVAIKVIGRRVGGRPDVLERFEQEARAASALNHPNIITVYDIGEEGGYPYIVMELVEGESLAAQTDEQEPRPCEEILRLGSQIADGLAAAHERGIVHRDLKPQNVMVDRHGRARILDFGVAQFRPVSSEARPQAETLEMRDGLTANGAVVGTPGYLAPEVLEGADADHRSDQFALGAILYELATGRSAFRRDTAAAGMRATLREDPTPISELRPDLPRELVDLVEHCLSKDPDRRFATTRELWERLEELTRHRRTPALKWNPLPAPTGPLYGRQQEVRELEDLLLDDEHRLVTLTGVGGSGKTRLALEVARRLEAVDAFSGGIGFVSLAAVDDAELVVPAIADAVGGVEASSGVELSVLIETLSEVEGQMLLVLDNFEHVVEAASRIADLLSRCPRLSVLVTSRELLRLSAEQDYPVRPLRLPREERLPEVSELKRVPAVEMFVGRAQNAAPEFDLTAENAPHVVEICRRLDGLPLALELAAARVRTFPPRAILRRLESRFDLLTGGARDLPDRQRTLRAAIAWSHDLLTGDEQALFRRLGVFVDGFTLEAAEAVADPFSNLVTPVVDGVESLLDQSLLAPHGADAEEARFAMLETVREYAVDQLGVHDEEEATRRAHAAYMLVLAEEGERLRTSGSESEWVALLGREQGNLRAALDWLLAEDDAAWGFRLAEALFPYWERGNDLSEGRRRLVELLALPSAQEKTTARARALFSAVVLSATRGDTERALEFGRECMEVYRELGDARGQAVALNSLGINYTDSMRFEEARACYERCLEFWEEVGENDGAARTLSNLAYVLRQQGEFERARRLYRRAAAMFERLGDDVGAAWETAHEADVARDQGADDARELYEEALGEFRRLGHSWGIGSTLVDLGAIARAEGSYERAVAGYREALRIFDEVGHQRGVARALEGLAMISSARGEHETVLLLASAAAELRSRFGTGAADREENADLTRAVEIAREEVGGERSEGLWEKGSDHSPDELLSRVPST